MSRELRAAILDVLAGFAAGFLLGPIRKFALVPMSGRVAARLVEMPVVLAFCGWISPRISRRCANPPGGMRQRMGFAALSPLLRWGRGAAWPAAPAG